MSSMLKRSGGLAFKPKAGRRPGAASATASQNTTRAPTAELSQTPVPASTPTPAPIPTASSTVEERTSNLKQSNATAVTANEPNAVPTPPPSKPAEPEAPEVVALAKPTPPAITTSNEAEISSSEGNSTNSNVTSGSLPATATSRNAGPAPEETRLDPALANLNKSVPDASSSAPLPLDSTSSNTETQSSVSQPTNTPTVSRTDVTGDTLITASTLVVPNAGLPSPATTAISQPSAQSDPALTSPSPLPIPGSAQNSANPTPPLTNGTAIDSSVEAPKKKRQYKKRKQLVEGQATETGEDGAAPPKPKRQRKKKITTTEAGQDGQPAANGEAAPAAPKRVRRRQTTPNPEDIPEDGRPDHTTTKIGDLTRDLGIGKKFKHADLIVERQRQARHDAKLRKIEKQKVAMGKLAPEDSQANDSRAGTPAAADNNNSDQATKANRGPGIDFDIIDGQIMINQSSLVINQHAAEGDVQLETVEEDEFTHLTTSASYLRPSRAMGSNQWDDADTEKFYKYLKMFGTDFETISHMFPGRNRRQIKLKFNREEKHRPNRVNAAIMARGEKRVAIDIDEYRASRVSDENWITPDKFNAEQELIRKEQEKELEARRQERRDLGLLEDDPATKKTGDDEKGAAEHGEEVEEMLIDDADVGGTSTMITT
ncbi:hypothetical protein PFICI_07496 [Pestalotiopsis fici W106-1]|uniref:Myb-like domain-containing protein n=1 Tax=Pestalotiopsis fici (strain W106-1 / CGMCC3.15140) TaxID=1229662 RepID=W3X3I9_PESFW|nr:uncharacterized protein PFICI_07496 [Pestalotiopsis fici W106-1]ETS79967.1 hypothetical protein PFICI_07496 [Pestalotiopsis fici W106-1]